MKRLLLFLCLILMNFACGQEAPNSTSMKSPDAKTESAGTIGGGGGNAFISTPEQIASMRISITLDFMKTFADAQYWQMLDSTNVDDEDLKKLFDAFNVRTKRTDPPNFDGIEDKELRKFFEALYVHGKPITELEADIWKTQHVPQEACYENGRETDASTQFTKAADICLNVNSLSRYAPEEAKLEILTLLFHEYAHHFGATEEVARKFQVYMKRIVSDIVDDQQTSPHIWYKELRPNGSIVIKGKGGTRYRVLCDTVQNLRKIPPSSRILSKDTLLITAGHKVILPGEKESVGVRCRNFHPVDCSIQGDYVFIGSLSASGDIGAPYESLNPQKELKKWQAAGVCR